MINAALIGNGYWANRILIPTVNACPLMQLKIIALKDISTNDFKCLLSDQGVDAVIVASPPNTHYQYVKMALSAGKHVYCEPPIAMTKPETIELIDLANKKNLIGAYSRPHFYLDAYDLLNQHIPKKNIIEAKFIWRPKVWLNATTPFSWRHDIDSGPPLIATIPLCIISDLFGTPVSAITKLNIFQKYRSFNGTKKEVFSPDMFFSTLQYNNFIVTIDARSFEADNIESSLTINTSNVKFTWKWDAKHFISLDSENSSFLFAREHNFIESFKLIDDFANSILYKQKPLFDFNIALRDYEIVKMALD